MAIFGKDTGGALTDNLGVGWSIGSLYTLPVAGTITGMSFYCKMSAAILMKTGIYDTARNRLGVTTEKSCSGAAYHWENYVGINLHLVASNYYLAVGIKAAQPTTADFKLDEGDANSSLWDNQYIPNPIQVDVSDNEKFLIYATYTPDVLPPKKSGLPNMVPLIVRGF